MKGHKTISRRVVFLMLLAMLFGASLLMIGASAADNEETPAAIRPAPAAPVFDEKERQAELAQRRARVAQTIGPKAILILFSAEPRVYANDVDYEYRQENNLYYLTQLKQKRATLVLLPGNKRTPEIIFIPRRDPLSEVWSGHMYTAKEAAQASGIREIWEARELEPFLQALRSRRPYRPKPESVLMTVSAAVPEAGTTTGFESAFAAAEKNE
ncbi:MAG: aminopeptidase P N-terminal domain-containing protein, partial [Pyrinomonadaceae bacterium]